MNTIEITTALVEAEIERQKKHWPMGNIVIDIKQVNDFVFAAFRAHITNTITMGRYGLYCIRGMEIIYSDSNVIDIESLNTITIDSAVKQTQTYFQHITGKLMDI